MIHWEPSVPLWSLTGFGASQKPTSFTFERNDCVCSLVSTCVSFSVSTPGRNPPEPFAILVVSTLVPSGLGSSLTAIGLLKDRRHRKRYDSACGDFTMRYRDGSWSASS